MDRIRQFSLTFCGGCFAVQDIAEGLSDRDHVDGMGRYPEGLNAYFPEALELIHQVADRMGQGLATVNGKEILAVQGFDAHAVGVFGADELAFRFVQTVGAGMITPRGNCQRHAPENLYFQFDSCGFGQRG